MEMFHVKRDGASFVSLASAQAQKLVHFTAPPFKIEPAALGFDFVLPAGGVRAQGRFT